MTKPDTIEAEEDFSPKRYWTHLIIWFVCLAFPLIGVAVIGYAAGYYSKTQNVTDLWIMLIGVPLVLVSGYFLWRTMPDFTMGEPDTARGRRTKWTTLGAGFLGGLTTIPLIDFDNGGTLLFSNGSVGSIQALFAMGMWAIILPVFIIIHRRNADEVAREANDFGFMVGFQTFSILAPVWWMGWRGGFLPQPDVMILFVTVLIIACAAIIWRRST
ncbi:MAG: hypothetical protein AAFN04_08895 [Pseudomonadota bacterium]